MTAVTPFLLEPAEERRNSLRKIASGWDRLANSTSNVSSTRACADGINRMAEPVQTILSGHTPRSPDFAALDVDMMITIFYAGPAAPG